MIGRKFVITATNPINRNNIMKMYTPRFRQSTETFTPNLWYVYKDFDTGSSYWELITSAESRQEALEITIKEHLYMLNECVSLIDPTLVVDAEFLEKISIEKLNTMQAIELFFNENAFDVSHLIPLKGNFPKDFKEAVDTLNRPYIALTGEQRDSIYALKSDYFLTYGGQVVTFGKASTHGGINMFALMPVNAEVSENILRDNDIEQGLRGVLQALGFRLGEGKDFSISSQKSWSDNQNMIDALIRYELEDGYNNDWEIPVLKSIIDNFAYLTHAEIGKLKVFGK